MDQREDIFKRTVLPSNGAPDVSGLNGAVRLEGRWNVDGHYALDDLQYVVNSYYHGRDNKQENTKKGFLNSLQGDDIAIDAAEMALQDFRRRFIDENGLAIKVSNSTGQGKEMAGSENYIG